MSEPPRPSPGARRADRPRRAEGARRAEGGRRAESPRRAERARPPEGARKAGRTRPAEGTRRSDDARPPSDGHRPEPPRRLADGPPPSRRPTQRPQRVRRKRRRPGWLVPLVTTVVALVLTGLLQRALSDDGREAADDARAGAATTTSPTPGDRAPRKKGPSPSGAARARLDLSALPIARAPFCNVLGEDAVRRALDGEITGTGHYDNGDEVEITPGFTDIAHEFNCTFEGETSTARTWVFARPVGRPEAKALVRAATAEEGCTTPEAIDFGAPGVTTVCEDAEQDQARARMQGLFEDSWLTCELTVPLDQTGEVARRAEEWCIDVATSLGARP